MTYHKTEVTLLEHHEPEAFRSRLSQRIINTPSPAAKSAFFYLKGCHDGQIYSTYTCVRNHSFLGWRLFLQLQRQSKRNERR